MTSFMLQFHKKLRIICSVEREKIKQRGSGFGISIVYLFFRIFGYKGLHFILFFVVLYYTLTTPKIKSYLKEYYLLVTGKFNFFIYYRHIYTFALVFADRIFSKQFLSRYTIDTYNSHVINLDKGLILLFSHVGDWSMCGLVPSKKKVRINMVMYEAIKESIKKFSQTIQDKNLPQLNVIDLHEGSMSVAIKVAKALQEKEIVGMMADRYLSKESAQEVKFFGKKVFINGNPFEVAYNRDIPLTALFSLRKGDYRYASYYHNLSPFDGSLSKEESIAKVAQEYMHLLEGVIKDHPDQWFNHYDFFETQSS